MHSGGRHKYTPFCVDYHYDRLPWLEMLDLSRLEQILSYFNDKDLAVVMIISSLESFVGPTVSNKGLQSTPQDNRVTVSKNTRTHDGVDQHMSQLYDIQLNPPTNLNGYLGQDIEQIMANLSDIDLKFGSEKNACQPAIGITSDINRLKPKKIYDEIWKKRAALFRKYQLQPSKRTRDNGAIDTVRINTNLALEMFYKHSKTNTYNNIETIAVFGGIRVNNDGRDEYIVTHIIFPQQKGDGVRVEVTTDGENDLVEIMIEADILQLGWIHSHPKHDLFLSSVDVHQQFRMQKILSSYFAIVHAPEVNPSSCIYSLSDFGMWIIGNCNKDGFHTHELESFPNQNELRPFLYGSAQHVINDDGLKIATIDRR